MLFYISILTNMDLLDFAILVPVTVGVVQAIKMAASHWIVDDYVKSFTPLVSMLVAIGLAYLGNAVQGLGFTPDVYVMGIVGGLAASGLYEVGKKSKKILTGK